MSTPLQKGILMNAKTSRLVDIIVAILTIMLINIVFIPQTFAQGNNEWGEMEVPHHAKIRILLPQHLSTVNVAPRAERLSGIWNCAGRTNVMQTGLA